MLSIIQQVLLKQQHIFRNVSTLKHDNKRMIQCFSCRYNVFSKDDEQKIMETINNASIDDFKKYNIKEADLKKILMYREKHGKFQVFDDMLLTQDVPSFIKFSRSILRERKKSSKPKSKQQSSLVTPSIDKNAKQRIKSILGLEVWNDRICWARIDENKCLTHWGFSTFSNPSKTTIIPFIDLILEIISKLPHADAYVMESDKYTMLTKLTSAAYTSYLQRQRVIMIIISILRKQYQSNYNDHNELIDHFYMLRACASVQRYDLVVGSEKISKESTVNAIIDEILSKKNTLISSMGDKVLSTYSSHNDVVREQHHSVLLILLTFVELLK